MLIDQSDERTHRERIGARSDEASTSEVPTDAKFLHRNPARYEENFASIRIIRSWLRRDAVTAKRAAQLIVDIPDTADVVNSMVARYFYQWADNPQGFQP